MSYELPDEVVGAVELINAEINRVRKDRRQYLTDRLKQSGLTSEIERGKLEAYNRSIRDLMGFRSALLEEFMPEPGSLHEAIKQARFIKSGGKEEESSEALNWPAAVALCVLFIGLMFLLPVAAGVGDYLRDLRDQKPEDNHAQPDTGPDRESPGAKSRQLPE